MSEAVELKEACHHTVSDQSCDKILDNSSSDNQENENNENLVNLENDSNVDEKLRDSCTENNDFGISDQNHTDTNARTSIDNIHPKVDENDHSSDSVGKESLNLQIINTDENKVSSILQKLEQLEKEIEDLRQTVTSKDLVEESKLHIKSSETDKHHQDKQVDIRSEHKGQRLKEEQKKTIKLESDHRSSNWRIAMQTGIVSSMITFLLGASIMYYREPATVQMINTTVIQPDPQSMQYFNSSVEILTAELNLSVKTLQAELEQCKANYTLQEDKLLHLKRNIALMNGTIEFNGGTISYYETVYLMLFGGVVEMMLMALFIHKFYSPRNVKAVYSRENQVEHSQSNIMSGVKNQPKNLLNKISRVPLERSVCVISFYEETKDLHVNLIKSSMQSTIPVKSCVIKSPENDLLSLPRSQLMFVFVDFNERNVVLENPGQDLGDKKVITVQAAQKMGADVFVVYFRDKGSAKLPEGDLFNKDLTSFTSHFLLKQLTARDRGLSVNEKFTPYQKNHIKRIVA